MIINERQSRHEQVLVAARQIMTAARTAPKAKGVDIIEIALIEGDDLKTLSDKMIAMVEQHGMKFFLRDADNVLNAECVIVIGTKTMPHGSTAGTADLLHAPKSPTQFLAPSTAPTWASPLARQQPWLPTCALTLASCSRQDWQRSNSTYCPNANRCMR